LAIKGADQESLLPTSKCPNVDQHKILISVSSPIYRGLTHINTLELIFLVLLRDLSALVVNSYSLFAIRYS